MAVHSYDAHRYGNLIIRKTTEARLEAGGGGAGGGFGGNVTGLSVYGADQPRTHMYGQSSIVDLRQQRGY